MILVVDVQESKGMQLLLQEFRENRLSHAFLIETNCQEKSLQSLLEFLSFINHTGDLEEDQKLDQLIENRSLPSLVVIEPDGQNIRKEQILDLKNFFKTKPIFSQYNMYIVLNSETLNASSANTMLKFLEEPEENILGFFLTNNKENIIDTIKSRCQIVLDYYTIDPSATSIPSVWKALAVNYVKEYEQKKDAVLLYHKDVLLPLIHDRKELNYLFQSLFQIYQSLYEAKLFHSDLNLELQPLSFLLDQDIFYFFSKLQYLLSFLDDLNYNVNINLFLDRFVLESR